MPYIRFLSALAGAALCLSTSTFGQVVSTWHASSGSLPNESATLWRRSASLGACDDATATLSSGKLVLDNSSACAEDTVSYSYGAGTDDQPAFWIEGECRVVQSSQSAGSGAVCLLGVSRSQTCGWQVLIDVDEVRFVWRDLVMATLAVDTTATSHTYRVVQESGTDLGALWIDGQPVLSSVPPGPNSCATGATIWRHAVWFGNFDATEGGITEWTRVTHNIGHRFTLFCTDSMTQNSAGSFGQLTPAGSSHVAANDLVLRATGLPPLTFGMLVGSESVREVSVVPPGGQGHLCLSGAIGRFNGPGQIVQSSAAGALDMALDLTQIPTPTGLYAVQPGDTWAFQLWYRDNNPNPTSNFTRAIAVRFD